MTSQKQFLYCGFLAALLGYFLPANAMEPGDVTWDLGVASGTYQLPGPPDESVTYSEVDFGLNYYLLQNWVWRNSPFVRFPTDHHTVGGLDTGLRLYEGVDISSKSGLTAFLGAGYRIETDPLSAPFAEGGMMFEASGLTIGGGAKFFFEKLVHSNLPTYVQYFLILGGSGML